MRKRARLEEYASSAVTSKVEALTARRENMPVGYLRILIRVAALTENGALVRSTDIQRAELSSKRAVREGLKQLLEKYDCLRKEGGGPVLGFVVLTSKGQRICEDYASAKGRAASALLAFEPVRPYQRVKPRKN